MQRYLRLLLQLFLAPRQGWDDLWSDPTDPDELARRGLYPLAALAALASFSALIYHSGASVIRLLVDAVLEFGAYFAGYFITIFALTTCLGRLTPDGAAPSQRAIHLFAVCMMGLMAAIGFVKNILPSDFAIVNFLYVYLVIIMWRAEPFLHVAAGKSVVFVILSTVSVIVPPLLIMML